MDFENKNNGNHEINTPEMQQQPVQPTQQVPSSETTQAEQPQHTAYHTQEMHTPLGSQQTDFHSYHTYQEWMAEENKRAAKQARREARRAKRQSNPHNHRKPLIVVGSIAAACVLLAGGIAIGGTIYGQSNNQVVAAVSTNSNLPSVQISSPSSTSSTSSTGLSGEEIYSKVSPSVVSVQAVNLSSGDGGTGSGVIMSADGYIITNNHVVTDENTGVVLDKITVYMSDGTTFPAEVKGCDEQTDLAVLKINPAGTTLTPAEFGDSNSLQPGEEVYAIGSPGGLELANTITGGHISALNRDITIDDRVMSLIQTDAAINPGNSGGALINKYGQVIGITSAKLGISYFEGLGFAIPMDTAKPIVDELIQNGYIAGRPQIGISGQNVSEQVSAAYGIPQGVRVIAVDSRSNAAAAGVQVNDIITGINGQEVTDMDGVNEVKDKLAAGDKITLTLYRMSTGKTVTVSFALNDQHDLEGDDPATTQQQQQQQQQQQDSQYYQNPFSYFFGW